MKDVKLPMQGSFSPEVVDRSEHPCNYGPLPHFNGHAKITGPCGDTMEFWILAKEGTIANAGFITDGCGASRAAGSMATELGIGKPIGEIATIDQTAILDGLRGLPPESEHCALLASNTLNAAVEESLRQKSSTSQDCAQCQSTTCSSKERRKDESDQEFRERQSLARNMCQIDKKLLVLSGKGGVGKSTVAANLATALAQKGKKVGLLDIDIHGPSVPGLTGLEGHSVHGSDEGIAPVRLNNNLAVMSIGFLLPSDREAVIWRGPRKYGIIRQFLKDVAWGSLDYLVVDSPPGTGDEPMSVAELVGTPSGAVIVTTPQMVAISDVRRCVTFCDEVALPVTGIVENMSGMVCPSCGERIDLFKRGGGAALAKEMNVPFLGQIPIDPEVVTMGDAGIPLLREGPQSPAAVAFAQVVDAILRS